MALPSKDAVDEALAGLADAVKGYSDAPDVAGHMARVEIIARAKSLIRSVVAPEMTPNYHGLNVGLPMHAQLLDLVIDEAVNWV
jgi:hypothetical protein